MTVSLGVGGINSFINACLSHSTLCKESGDNTTFYNTQNIYFKVCISVCGIHSAQTSNWSKATVEQLDNT